jgi:4-cresol dehydrogenase (hydroxylating) cytochrome subunit
MKPAAVVVLALALATGAVAGAHAQSAGQWRGPEHMWESACGYCHGAGVAPELRGRGLPASLIRKIAREGYAAMPAFHPSEFSDQDLSALADWIAKSQAPPKPPTPEAPK